eukprot:1154746-Pelagomonas_calceolata.AAC.6
MNQAFLELLHAVSSISDARQGRQSAFLCAYEHLRTRNSFSALGASTDESNNEGTDLSQSEQDMRGMREQLLFQLRLGAAHRSCRAAAGLGVVRPFFNVARYCSEA